MVIITMNQPENKKCQRDLLPAAYFAVSAKLLMSSYYYGQTMRPLGPSRDALLARDASLQAGEGGWRFLPRISVFETYTDNVTFARGNLKESDFITQLNPGISVLGVGRRFNVNVNYTMNNLIYANNSNFTRVRHQLNANGTAELIENLFFVDGRAMNTQQNAT
jgi:hypothetical protein